MSERIMCPCGSRANAICISETCKSCCEDPRDCRAHKGTYKPKETANLRMNIGSSSEVVVSRSNLQIDSEIIQNPSSYLEYKSALYDYEVISKEYEKAEKIKKEQEKILKDLDLVVSALLKRIAPEEMGDCPICFDNTMVKSDCCSGKICRECSKKLKYDSIVEGKPLLCVFCRKPIFSID